MRTAEAVIVDTVRCHISCGELVFADLGPTLSVWSYAGANLTPALAVELGQALLTWGQRKQAAA